MRVPLSWLSEFVTLQVPLEELLERLPAAGIEVGSIERVGADWDRERILVGEITAVRQHPNADRLTLATVAYGGGRSIEVVTGAPNVTIGLSGVKVALALSGARLVDAYAPEGGVTVLKPSKIRGVRSEGMVCSEKELGISAEHGGMVLKALADYLAGAVRQADLLCRYGAEEFVVLLPQTPGGQAHIMAERLREGIAQTAIDLSDHQITITVSMGVAGLTPDRDGAALVNAAHAALYRAKNTGKNRVCCSTEAERTD